MLKFQLGFDDVESVLVAVAQPEWENKRPAHHQFPSTLRDIINNVIGTLTKVYHILSFY